MEQDHKPAPRFKRGAPGQSLVEYALIAAMVILALIVALIATGPAIGDVFSSAVFAALGADDAPEGVSDGPTAFWLTVTWVSSQTPEGFAQGTNVPDIPTETPIGYVAPTEPPPLPTNTMIPSPTYTPSHTPEDRTWDLTFEDGGGDPESRLGDEDNPNGVDRYRLTNSTYVGLHAWTARFFQDGAGGTPLDLGNLRYSTSYWQNPGVRTFFQPGTDIPRITEQWFSTQLRRELYVNKEDARISFRINNPGGGVRLYYQDDGLCDGYKPPSNARGATSPNSTCMIIDEWNDAPAGEIIAYKTFDYNGPADDEATFTGPYVLYLEYYHKTGAPNLQLEIDSPKINPDDAGLNGAPVSCNWGPYEGERSNVRPFAWNSAVGLDGNNIPDNQRCYLELRGFIELTPEDELRTYEGQTYGNTTVPTFTFWHIWDLNSGTNVWLEVAPYDNVDGDGNPTGRPEDVDWQKVWPPADLNNTRNYEWVQEEVLLTGYDVGDRVSYRFVIENDGGGGGRKRWYVDDIRLGSRNLPTLDNVNSNATFGICEDTTTCDSYWSMEDTVQVQRDFRTTGRWALTSSGAHIGSGLGDDPGDRYSLESGADLNSVPTDRRIYWVEFDRRVDVSDTTDNGVAFLDSVDDGIAYAPPDEDGDDGAPMLTFWHSYNLKDYVSLQVQYYDDNDGDGDPYNNWKLLREVVRTRAAAEAGASSTFVQVPLNEREIMDENGYGTGEFDTYDVDANGDGNFWRAWADGPIRVRFAMIVDENAINNAQNGWTIDDIELERLGNFTFTPYPFGDSAGDSIIVRDESRPEDQRDITFVGFEDSLDRWLRTGTWAISEERARTGDYVFSDSPNDDYIAGSNSTLELRAPIDLNSDTPDNPFGLACDATLPTVTTCDPNPHPAANTPMLTFWWNRAIASGGRFTVEIRQNSGLDAPVTVWEYSYSSTNGTQPAWERVEIDLSPFVREADDVNIVTDDDIVLAFRLDARGNTSARANGVFVDDIRLQDAAPSRTFRLWDGDSDGVEGDGNRYIDTIDERTIIDSDSDQAEDSTDDRRGKWWNRWHLGGDWFSDYYEYMYLGEGAERQTDLIARSGTQVFHESPPTSEDPFDENNSFRYEARSYNVLEMVRTVDMTGLDTTRSQGDPPGIATGGENGSPFLYWWQRLDRGDDSRLMVQVATRQDNPPADRVGNPLTYGNDELYGWSNWQTVYMTDNDDEADYAWVREAVNLANAPIYNGSGDITDRENFIGEEIRVRFVLDATRVTSQGDRRDGWFIDDVEFTTNIPRIHPVPFYDPARNLSNWITEGTWGLDVTKSFGSTGAVLTGSEWTARYVNCEYRPYVDSGPLRAADGNRGGCDGGDISNQMLSDVAYRNTYGVGTYNPGDQWYLEDTIASQAFDYDYNDLPNDSPPNAPGNRRWNNNFAAEFQRTVVVTNPFRYQFYVRSDDGVRVGVTPFPTTAEVQRFGATSGDVNLTTGTLNYTHAGTYGGQQVFYNNVIDAWVDQAPAVYQGAVTLIPNEDGSPREYLITVHYYEKGSGAEIAFGIAGASASFSDSPVLVPQDAVSEDEVDRVPANYLSNSSMMLDGLLDLRSTRKPIIQYYTQYDFNGYSGTAYLEVSEDGGFTWQRSGLRADVNYPGGQVDGNSRTRWGGKETDEWEERTNSLEDYAGQMISLRFRVDVDSDINRVEQEATDNDTNRADGLYVTELLVYDLQPNTPEPRIVINPPLSVFVSTGESQQLSVVAGGSSPLRYEWFQGTPPLDDPGEPGTTPPGNIAVGTNLSTFTPPSSLDPGTYTYWVRVSNSVSDNNPDIPAAISVPTEYRVSDCIPVNLGDCNIYRINVGGQDEPSRDGTRPGWFGDNDSATAFRPDRGWDSIDAGIGIPNISSNEFVRAAISGAAPEILYQRWRTHSDSMTWSFPVEPGEYTVRLYLTDPYNSQNQGRVTVQINGTTASYKTSGTTQPFSGVDLYDLIGGVSREAAVIEMSAVTVTPAQNVLNIQARKESGNRVYISGIEVFPVTSLDPEIIQPPTNTTVAEGGVARFEVSATGANLSFEWFRGTTGDDTDPITDDEVVGGRTYNIATNVNGLTGTSVLSITNVTANQNVWVRVTGGPDNDQVQDSNTAQARTCVYDPATAQNGECGFWFININGDTGATPILAADGTRWFSESDGQPWDSTNANYASNNLDSFTYGNVLEDHVPREVFQRYAQMNSRFGWSLDMDYPSAALGGGNGVYDVTIYVADRNNDEYNRSMNIYIEGELVSGIYPDGYHPEKDPACGGANRLCSVTFSDIEVADGDLDIEFESTGSNATRVNAIEVQPR